MNYAIFPWDKIKDKKLLVMLEGGIVQRGQFLSYGTGYLSVESEVEKIGTMEIYIPLNRILFLGIDE